MTANRIRIEVLPTTSADQRAGMDRWKVTRNGQAATSYRTQRQAIAAAAAVARDLLEKGRHSTIKIKGRNGRIRDERTYGADPRRTKG